MSKKPDVVSKEFLKGTKVAFFVSSQKTIFVSPAIKSLLESDWESMKGKLHVLEMPVSPNTGKDIFDSLEDWFEVLKEHAPEQIFFQGNSHVDPKLTSTVGDNAGNDGGETTSKAS